MKTTIKDINKKEMKTKPYHSIKLKTKNENETIKINKKKK